MLPNSPYVRFLATCLYGKVRLVWLFLVLVESIRPRVEMELCDIYSSERTYTNSTVCNSEQFVKSLIVTPLLALLQLADEDLLRSF